MSHVVITRTTTSTTDSSTVVLNTGYLKTLPGLLKVLQLILGAVIVGLIAYYYTPRYYIYGNPDLFLFLMSVTFLIGTFCLLASCLVSLSTGGIISKTIYELVYHSVASILYFAASLFLLIEMSKVSRNGRQVYDFYMAASVIGVVNSVLYLISAVYANRSYKGI